jgi:hypothetical protein
LFGRKYGNLEKPVLTYDYTEEMNYIYAGGQGEKSGRKIKTSSDSDRIGKSPWNRREGFKDARSTGDTDAAVQDAADDMLAASKPRVTFAADILDTKQARFGVDWFWGDKVTCEYVGLDFDGVIKVLHVNVDDKGKEKIKARVEVEE